jgi:hypothetical protein
LRVRAQVSSPAAVPEVVEQTCQEPDSSGVRPVVLGDEAGEVAAGLEAGVHVARCEFGHQLDRF